MPCVSLTRRVPVATEELKAAADTFLGRAREYAHPTSSREDQISCGGDGPQPEKQSSPGGTVAFVCAFKCCTRCRPNLSFIELCFSFLFLSKSVLGEVYY